MSTTIVSHMRPDLDACTASWLIKRFYPGFSQADIAFVPVGKTLNGEEVDSKPNVIHVDTGFGRFDHHQFKERSSAALRIFEYLKTKRTLSPLAEKVLERLVEVVTAIDNFEESSYPNPTADFYDCALHQLIEGYKASQKEDEKVMVYAFDGLESFFTILKHKVRAETDIAEGVDFTIGKFSCLGLLTRNEEAVTLAQKQGFALVIRKDPKTQRARIKVRPDVSLTLEKVYDAISKKDRVGYWFFHKSGKMVLNGSSKNPDSKPTSLTLQELIQLTSLSLEEQ
ncbi:MAG: hypothetical protein NUV65_02790 [Candidatus Roizmanbacteria bacterium]|nr:hypothetical protein [Candidatus Roizmanbacteria bacterium]